MTASITNDEGSGNTEAPPACYTFGEPPADRTETQAEADSLRFTSKHELPCRRMVTGLLRNMYRTPPNGLGPESRDNRPIDSETLRRCKQLFDEARSRLYDMASLLHYKSRLAIPHIVNSDSSSRAIMINSAVANLIFFGETRDDPLSTPSMFLREWINWIGHYFLFTTAEAAFFDNEGAATEQRQMVIELLETAGWFYDPAEIDLVCTAVQRDLYGKRPGSSGLRASRAERAEAKAWREARGLA